MVHVRAFTLAGCFAVVGLLGIALSGCGGHGTAGNTEQAASATAVPTVAQATVEPQATSTGASSSPAPEATPTPNTNLLASVNGTIVRSYPASVDDLGSNPENGMEASDGSHGPYSVVFELPGVATISSFSLTLPSPEASAAPATATIAVSTTGADNGFHDAGTITANADGTAQQLTVTTTARWVKITTNTSGTDIFDSIGAFGTLAPRPSNVSLDGAVYAEAPHPYASGAFVGATKETDPWYDVAAADGNGLTLTRCLDRKYGDTYPGMLDGRIWTFVDDATPYHAVINDDGSIISGQQDGPDMLVRTNLKPKYCEPFVSGNGPRKYLVLDSQSQSGLYPIDDNSIPGYQYTRVGAGMVSNALLAGKNTVIINMLCDTSKYLNTAQGQELMQFVSSGHKLMIYDADECPPHTQYAFLPYQFTTSNPGAEGAKGDRLIQVEDDELGTSDKTDKAHFFDTAGYVQDESNQIGDANTVTTQDSHWCGHLFGTNVLGVNGFMQMYALYGKGTIIYDGFDHDDGSRAGYQRIRQLEFTLPIPNDLQCTQKVSLAFILQPNQTGTFVPGKAVKMKFPMELLGNQGWEGHVTISSTGDFPATITPNSFDIAGKTQPLAVLVSIPKTAKPGNYAIIVNATGKTTGNVATPNPSSTIPPNEQNLNDAVGAVSTAQATIQLVANVPMVKQLKVQRRIRLYGIHFDVDSARIKPESETVIAQIAQIMKQNPAWHFRVEGHTDSDGGFAHNMVLSQHRAESVVRDLVHRYHIARSRLVPKGYGYTHPVASNSTSAGKALNRRVELFRL